MQVLGTNGQGLCISRTRTDGRKDDRKWKKIPMEVREIVRPLRLKEDATSFKEMPTANEPMFANLFGGTTPGPIVHYLPEVRS